MSLGFGGVMQHCSSLWVGRTPFYVCLHVTQALGCKTTHSNQEVLQTCQLVFFATKPHILPSVLAEVASVVTSQHILVSVAAGISLSTLEEVSGLVPVSCHCRTGFCQDVLPEMRMNGTSGCQARILPPAICKHTDVHLSPQLLPPVARVLRVSPNLPCMVQEGAIVLARGRHVGDSEAQLLQTLLGACGQCEEVPEVHIDVHTGLSGSGVAFVSVVPLGLPELGLGHMLVP